MQHLDTENSLHNDKQEKFCQLIANATNQTAAYVSAGYSDKGAAQSAIKLLKNPKVAERIAHLKKIKSQLNDAIIDIAVQKSGVSKAWVIEQLVENVQIAKSAEPVRDKDGNPIGEYKSNINAANKALELIGSELGMFVTKIEKGAPGEFERLSDEELEKRIADNDRAIQSTRDVIRKASTPTAITASRD